jgi:hypothetical protein
VSERGPRSRPHELQWPAAGYAVASVPGPCGGEARQEESAVNTGRSCGVPCSAASGEHGWDGHEVDKTPLIRVAWHVELPTVPAFGQSAAGRGFRSATPSLRDLGPLRAMWPIRRSFSNNKQCRRTSRPVADLTSLVLRHNQHGARLRSAPRQDQNTESNVAVIDGDILGLRTFRLRPEQR